PPDLAEVLPEDGGGNVGRARARGDVPAEVLEPEQTVRRHGRLGDLLGLDRHGEPRKLDAKYVRLETARHRARTQRKRASRIDAVEAGELGSGGPPRPPPSRPGGGTNLPPPSGFPGHPPSQ